MNSSFFIVLTIAPLIAISNSMSSGSSAGLPLRPRVEFDPPSPPPPPPPLPSGAGWSSTAVQPSVLGLEFAATQHSILINMIPSFTFGTVITSHPDRASPMSPALPSLWPDRRQLDPKFRPHLDVEDPSQKPALASLRLQPRPGTTASSSRIRIWVCWASLPRFCPCPCPRPRRGCVTPTAGRPSTPAALLTVLIALFVA
mmetsp:Transcript_22702/g.46020  ORF Transcript_22702/g.46020 Transcript_22702/m.46020 type:complete len:200 (-) Transcript_22702:594-1193(-)